MPTLVAGIWKKVVDGRDKPGHDAETKLVAAAPLQVHMDVLLAREAQ